MSIRKFTPEIQTKACPLERNTGPRSRWRDVLGNMKPGHWFEVPPEAVSSTRTAAVKHTRGRYSLYQHPEKDGYYIYLRIK
jgi:hypothetical protein